MATLFITEQNSIIRKTSDRLIVEKDDTVLLEIPCLKIETVLIYGSVQVTSQALAEMLDHGIELALLSRSGRLRGQLTPPKAKNMPLRMRQYELSRSEGFCLDLARSLVAARSRARRPCSGGFRRIIRKRSRTPTSPKWSAPPRALKRYLRSTPSAVSKARRQPVTSAASAGWRRPRSVSKPGIGGRRAIR